MGTEDIDTPTVESSDSGSGYTSYQDGDLSDDFANYQPGQNSVHDNIEDQSDSTDESTDSVIDEIIQDAIGSDTPVDPVVAETPAAPVADPVVTALQAQVSQLTEMFGQFMQNAQAAPVAPAAPVVPDEPTVNPWELSSGDIHLASARNALGDVSPALHTKYAKGIETLTRWNGIDVSTDPVKQAQKDSAVASIRRDLQDLHREAKHEATTKDLQAQIHALKNAPESAARTARTQDAIHKGFTAEKLAESGYPSLSAALASGKITAEKALRGIDFSVIDMGNPDTFEAFENRLSILNDALDGYASSIPAKTPATPVQTTPSTEGVSIKNPGAISVPNEPGAAVPSEPRYLTDEESEALFKNYRPSPVR